MVLWAAFLRRTKDLLITYVFNSRGAVLKVRGCPHLNRDFKTNQCENGYNTIQHTNARCKTILLNGGNVLDIISSGRGYDHIIYLS